MMIDEILTLVKEEYQRARDKHAPMHSGHEGYAVILEELDKLWGAVRADDFDHAKDEAIQVAAMAVAFILEV